MSLVPLQIKGIFQVSYNFLIIPPKITPPSGVVSYVTMYTIVVTVLPGYNASTREAAGSVMYAVISCVLPQSQQEHLNF